MPDLDKVLSLLGLARRARLLVIGQDNVKSRMGGENELLLIFPEDTSPKLFASLTKNLAPESFIMVHGLSVERLSHAIGASAKVVALPGPLDGGFAGKVTDILSTTERSGAVEQDKNIRTRQDDWKRQQGDNENPRGS